MSAIGYIEIKGWVPRGESSEKTMYYYCGGRPPWKSKFRYNLTAWPQRACDVLLIPKYVEIKLRVSLAE